MHCTSYYAYNCVRVAVLCCAATRHGRSARHHRERRVNDGEARVGHDMGAACLWRICLCLCLPPRPHASRVPSREPPLEIVVICSARPRPPPRLRLPCCPQSSQPYSSLFPVSVSHFACLCLRSGPELRVFTLHLLVVRRCCTPDRPFADWIALSSHTCRPSPLLSSFLFCLFFSFLLFSSIPLHLQCAANSVLLFSPRLLYLLDTCSTLHHMQFMRVYARFSLAFAISFD